ncbi:MAG TPA: hypothetical protein VGF81_04110 [Solirubrobacteraceae bacterium]
MLLGAARGSAASIAWSSPTLIDPAPSQQFPTSGSLVGVSCPTARLCVAVDDAGNVFTSSNPAIGSWTRTATQLPAPAAIACPPAQLCVVVTGYGDVVSSTNPGAAGATWRRVRVDPKPLVGFSCPSVQKCVAVDRAGNAVSTVNPSGVAAPGSASASIR